MHLELRGFDYVYGRHQAVNDEREAGAVVDANGICFANYADGGFGASGDENGVRDGGFDFQHAVMGIVVFNDPLVAVEFSSWGFLRAHALWFRLFTRQGGLAAGGSAILRCGASGSRRNGRAGAESRVLMGLRGWFDFAEMGRNRFTF